MMPIRCDLLKTESVSFDGIFPRTDQTAQINGCCVRQHKLKSCRQWLTARTECATSKFAGAWWKREVRSRDRPRRHRKQRIFRESGRARRGPEKALPVLGATTPPRSPFLTIGSRWALDAANGPSPYTKRPRRRLLNHYKPFWKMEFRWIYLTATPRSMATRSSSPRSSTCSAKASPPASKKFVKNGGKFVATYLTGIV